MTEKKIKSIRDEETKDANVVQTLEKNCENLLGGIPNQTGIPKQKFTIEEYHNILDLVGKEHLDPEELKRLKAEAFNEESLSLDYQEREGSERLTTEQKESKQIVSEQKRLAYEYTTQSGLANAITNIGVQT